MATQRQEMTVSRGFSFAPQTLEEAEKYAGIIANSGICPQALKGRPGDVLVILQMGYELNLKPMEALRSLGCINGIPFAYGDGLLALVKRHPEFVNIKEWLEGDLNTEKMVAYCTITRKGQEPQTRSFSVDDAKRAGLWKKSGVWQQYPKRMLQHRARGFACKDMFPDALYGLMSEDEVKGIVPPQEMPKTNSTGMKGFKEAIGIVKEGEVIDVEMEVTADTVEDAAIAVSPLDELKELIKRLDVTKASVTVTLKKFGVSSFEELTDEMINKWSNHLKSKEQQNDQG